jgi:hypothetical protein
MTEQTIESLEKKITELEARLDRECDRQYDMHERTTKIVGDLVNAVGAHFQRERIEKGDE